MENTLDLSRTLLGDNMGALEQTSDMGVTDLSPSNNFQPPPSTPLNEHPSESTSHTASAIGLPAGDFEDLWLQDTIHLGSIKTTAEFVNMLQESTLDDPSLGMSCEALD